VGLAVAIGVTATANAWRSPGDNEPPYDLTKPALSSGAAGRRAGSPPDGGDPTAGSGGKVCWYKQKIKYCRSRCSFRPFDCQPQFDLPCEGLGDCEEQITKRGECERDEKGCKAILTRCGCSDAGPGACCFFDGSCEDLLFTDCTDRDGRWNFGEECDSYRCPLAGACCITDAKCRVLLESDCRTRDGGFLGEEVPCRRACPCSLIKKFEARCSGGGTIKINVRLKDDSRDGEAITIGIGHNVKFDIVVRGKRAKRSVCCFEGEQTVKLREPKGCVKPIVVECP